MLSNLVSDQKEEKVLVVSTQPSRAICEVAKVTNLFSDFAFLSTVKSAESRIKNPFLDSTKGRYP